MPKLALGIPWLMALWQNNMKHAYLWLLAILLCSCGKSSLTIQTDYLTHKNLASYYVGTPDPRQNVPTVGQRLIISWSIPKDYLRYDNLRLEITIRFRNREEIIEIFYLHKTRGTYVFTLLNCDYFTKRGILTYKIDLIGGDCTLEEWRHLIWTDLILINQERETQEEEEIEDYPIDWSTEYKELVVENSSLNAR